MAKIKVAIAGINGRMGRASINALIADDDFEIVGGFGRANADYVGKDLSFFLNSKTEKPIGIAACGSFEEMMAKRSKR